MGSLDKKTTQHAMTGGPVPPARAHALTNLFQGNNRFVFESDQVPATDRIDMTRDLAGRLFGGIDLLPTNDPGFRAGMWASRAGEVVFGSGYVTSIKFHLGSTPNTFSSSTSRRQDEEGIFWIYQRGKATVQQGAVDGVRDAGSAWFMHADMPGSGVTDGTQVLGINLPSKALRRAVGHDRHLAPVALPRGNPLIQLLTGYIESAKQLPADTDPALLTSIGNHLTELVGLALGPTRDAAEQAENGGLKSARLDAVLRAIEANYADPDFSVADVAARLKLSVRYVQDILHETGIGFSERVLELRLQEACNLLSRAHMTNRKVSDIAFSCGFNNLSYFHRAFRRRFGVTPAGARSS
jgi:AraC-like DNA-binding protein